MKVKGRKGFVQLLACPYFWVVVLLIVLIFYGLPKMGVSLSGLQIVGDNWETSNLNCDVQQDCLNILINAGESPNPAFVKCESGKCVFFKGEVQETVGIIEGEEVK